VQLQTGHPICHLPSKAKILPAATLFILFPLVCPSWEHIPLGDCEDLMKPTVRYFTGAFF
jgi:hypothetical protein